MKPFVKWMVMLCVFSGLLALAAPPSAANPDLPRMGLENRIAFWTRIFTSYGAADVVLHDSYYVNLIYDVASDADVDAKERSVRTSLVEIRSKWTTPKAWTADTKRIYDAVDAAISEAGMTTSVEIVKKLENNVHRQRGIKERFRDGVVRSGRYIDRFRETFRKAGLPEELALLPMVESSFVNARSRVGAVGIWQIMPDTGRSYLKINNTVDERLDAFKATEAAARILGENYRALGVWPLAVTAYNHGLYGMLRAQKLHGNDLVAIIQNYDSPIFGYASANFYAELLTAVQVYENYPQYFGQLTLDAPEKPEANTTKLAAAAPTAKPKAAAATAEKYKVRSGDTLWEIAKKYGTSIRALMERNSLDKPLIYAGQMLLVR